MGRLRVWFALRWWACFGLGVCAVKNLRKHARMVFCSARPSTTRALLLFFHHIPAPPKPSNGVGVPLNTKNRSPLTRGALFCGAETGKHCLWGKKVLKTQVNNAQAATKLIVATVARSTGCRTSVFKRRANQLGKASGEWVCLDKNRRKACVVEGRALQDSFRARFRRFFAAHTPSATLSTHISKPIDSTSQRYLFAARYPMSLRY